MLRGGIPDDENGGLRNFNGSYIFNGIIKAGKKISGIHSENGKEFFVDFDKNQVAINKKRSFRGVKLMIVGNKDVGKTTFKTRLLASTGSEKENKIAHKKVQFVKKEEDMVKIKTKFKTR